MKRLAKLLNIFCLVIISSACDQSQTVSESDLKKDVPPDRRVTPENMFRAPYNRWTLQHLREFVPTRNVATGKNLAEFKRNPMDLSALEVSFPGGSKVNVGEWLESAYTDGFVVLHRGEIVFERYYNNQLPSTQHLMYSVTKSFTGTMMLMLMEQGLVDGSKLVSHYVPELAESAFGDATIEQILDMTNSITFVENYTDPRSHIAGFGRAMAPGAEGLYAYLQSLTQDDKKFKHGEAFHYVTPDPEVLGWIISRATGLSLAEAMHKLIWAPLGAENEGYYWLDFHGTEMAGGGLSITLRDAARFGQMILQDGSFDGRQVISPAIAQRIKTKRNFKQFARYYDDAWYGEIADSYHDQWWGYTGVNAVAALGVYGQSIYINSDADVVIAKQSSDTDAENERTENETVFIMHGIAAYLSAATAANEVSSSGDMFKP